MDLIKLTISCCLIITTTTLSIAQDVIINEIVASNSIQFDEDGNTPDWIELYNTSAGSISLNNWTLSDNIENPSKWTFPDYSLNQDEYLLVWASSKDRKKIGKARTLINQGDPFSYIVPNQNPDPSWTNLSFNDASWDTGNSGFGYGDGDDETNISNGTRSVYIRKIFSIGDLADIKELILDIDYDDAFVAYINGVEIARANINGNPPNYNGATISDHEAAIYNGGKPDRFEINDFESILQSGNNVLAIQAHNISNTSSDFSVIPFLSAVFAGSSNLGIDPPSLLELEDRRMHTNFKISSTKETVYLFNHEGSLIDSLAVENMISNVSYGVKPSDNTLVYFQETTPEAINETESFESINQSKIEFSHQGGSCGPISLTLSGIEADETIRFTRDATVPTNQSEIYNNAISINTPTVIRASIFAPQQIPSISQSRAYLVNINHDLPIVNLISDPYNLFDEDYGMYVYGTDYNNAFPHFGANFWEDWERPIHLSFYEKDGTHGISFNGGAKIFGGWSRGQEMRSFSIFARNEYGQKEINYPMFKNLDYQVFQSIVLRNSGNDLHNSNMRDGMITSLFQGSGLEIQSYRPAVTYINGEYWGFYNLREKVSEHFLSSKHGIDPDDIDLLEFSGELIHGDNTDYLSMIDFLNVNNLSSDDNYNLVANQIDVNNFIMYYVAQIYADNQDWPGNNIKFWKPKNGKWRWILFDTDFGFGTWNNNAYVNNTLAFALESNGPNWPNPPWSTLLFRKLTQNQKFKHQFINRFADEMNTRLIAQNVSQHISNIAAQIESEIPAHFERWGESNGNWTNTINNMKVYANNRLPIVKQDILNEFNLPNYHSINLKINEVHRGLVQLNSLSIIEENWSGDYFETVPIKLTALPYPGYVFSHWEGYNNSTNTEIFVDLSQDATLTAVFESGISENSGVIINEINYNDISNFQSGDWIELYNRGSESVDISNWTLKDGLDENSFTIPANTILGSNEYLVLAKDLNVFNSAFDIQNVIGSFNFGLSSDTETIRLFDDSENVINEITYLGIAPWPHQANGLGYTLELLHPDLDNTLPENYGPVHLHGSPGKTNLLNVGTPPINPEFTYKIYPNPAIDKIHLYFTNDRSDTHSYQLFNNQGQWIKNYPKQNVSEGEQEILFDLRSLSAGSYFLSVQKENGMSHVIPFLKI